MNLFLRSVFYYRLLISPLQFLSQEKKKKSRRHKIRSTKRRLTGGTSERQKELKCRCLWGRLRASVERVEFSTGFPTDQSRSFPRLESIPPLAAKTRLFSPSLSHYILLIIVIIIIINNYTKRTCLYH